MKVRPSEGPVRRDFLPFSRPLIDEAAIGEVVETLRSGWLTTGPRVARFEELFRDYVGMPHAIALNSCTAGLHLSLLAAGVGPGDEVITTSLTFVATVNVIVHAGARPVLVDIDRSTQNIDPDRIADAITDRTKAILPVHMAGRPCDLDAIHAIATERGLVVVEDAAHAVGASFRGKKIGAVSPLTSFSFYANKNVTTGEGGMVTTANEDWANTIRAYSRQGLVSQAWDRHSNQGRPQATALLPGYKYNMMDLQAAIGIHQLPHVDEWRRAREAIWQRYDRELAELPLETPADADRDTEHARHLYTVLLDLEAIGHSRDWVRHALWQEGIGTSVHFVAVHLHPYYREHLRYGRGDLPNAEWVSERTLSLPLEPTLSEQDVSDVVAALRKVIARSRRDEARLPARRVSTPRTDTKRA